MNYFEELDKQKNLLLTNIFEPEENSLHLEITVTKLGDAQELIIGNKNLGLAREVINDNKNIYKIYFPYYVAYSVINESYDYYKLDETFTGNSLRIYEKSKFLDYLKSETFATDEYPGKIFTL